MRRRISGRSVRKPRITKKIRSAILEILKENQAQHNRLRMEQLEYALGCALERDLMVREINERLDFELLGDKEKK